MRLDQRREAVRHRGDDLVDLKFQARRHHLVAGGKDRHLWLAADREFRLVHGGGKHQLAGPKPCTGSKQHLAFFEVLTARADMAAAGGVLDGDHT